LALQIDDFNLEPLKGATWQWFGLSDL